MGLSEGSEGLSEGSERLPEGPEGLPEGPEGPESLPERPEEAQGGTDGRTEFLPILQDLSGPLPKKYIADSIIEAQTKHFIVAIKSNIRKCGIVKRMG